MAVLDRPDDVLRSEGGIAAEEHAGARGLKSHLVDARYVPLVELDAEIALDPREGVLLADRENDIIGGEQHLTEAALARDAAFGIDVIRHLVEQHPGQLAVRDDK